MEKATFASGCFWCTEAVFKRLKGIHSVVSGYSGGKKENPTYEEVSSGRLGYAESIQVEFDPSVIPYTTLVEIFFHTHDPTTVNRQGNDVGTQYRSVIFYHNQQQREIAVSVKKGMKQSKTFKDTIVTEIIPYKNFYSAESYHQDFYDKNREYPY